MSVDEFDEICKNWFRCRGCNDKHIGGSCHDENVNPHTNTYTYAVTQNIYDDVFVTYDCTENINGCDYDTCLIDVEYVQQISAYLDLNSPFTATPVSRLGDCPRSTEPVIARFCNGTAPDLYTTKIVVPPVEFDGNLNLGTGLCANFRMSMKVKLLHSV